MPEQLFLFHPYSSEPPQTELVSSATSQEEGIETSSQPDPAQDNFQPQPEQVCLEPQETDPEAPKETPPSIDLKSLKAVLSPTSSVHTLDERTSPNQSHPPDAIQDNKDERIYHLEQALDQALRYLDELDAQVKQQTVLEEKLTLTEEYAYVQYQTIARLQGEIDQHHIAIDQGNQTIAQLESDKTLIQTNLLSVQQDQLSLRQENAQWKNACQELQQECDRQHRKMAALEQENAVMQEQILQQARQSDEHETAVQYWKDRYTSMLQHLTQLQELLELKFDAETDVSEWDSANVAKLLDIVRALNLQGDDNPNHTLPVPNPHAFSIPNFLIKRYRYRTKGSPNAKTSDP